MNSSSVRIGTRGSQLALWQANEVRRLLGETHPELAQDDAVEIKIISTSGDRILDGSLSEYGGKGLFTKEIEEALLHNEVDMAVHSLKDVPTQLAHGLEIDCVLPREDARDALICPLANTIEKLPQKTTVGTSSLRRKAILLKQRPDLRVVPFRGNVDTRLKKLSSGVVDATLLAVAGLKRLGVEGIGAQPLDPEEMLPAVCQGTLGIERRADDEYISRILEPLNDSLTELRSVAEREFLGILDGSCQTPIAAFAELDGNRMRFRGAIARPDGSRLLKTERYGPLSEAITLSRDAAAELKGRAGYGFFDA